MGVGSTRISEARLLAKVRRRMAEIEAEHEYLAGVAAFLADLLGGRPARGRPSRIALAVRSAIARYGLLVTPGEVVAMIARGRPPTPDTDVTAPEVLHLAVLDALRSSPEFRYYGEGRWGLAEWRRQLPSPEMAASPGIVTTAPWAAAAMEARFEQLVD